jgi:hypothetical protein
LNIFHVIAALETTALSALSENAFIEVQILCRISRVCGETLTWTKPQNYFHSILSGSVEYGVPTYSDPMSI